MSYIEQFEAELLRKLNGQALKQQAALDAVAKAEKELSEKAEKEKNERAAAAAREAQRLAALAAEKEKYLGYLNTNIVRTAGNQMFAVACVTENRTVNHAISDALATRFRTNDAEFVTSFFRPTLVTEGVFDAVFDGSAVIFKKMELERFIDGVLLAKQEVQYSTNESLENVITATMHLQVAILPVTGQVQSQSWTLSARGAGFNRADARIQAEERMIEQITENPTMSLVMLGKKN